MDRLEELFLSYAGVAPVSSRRLTPSGSPRTYFRMESEGVSIIGVLGTDADENRAFIALAQKFRLEGLNAPEVYAVSSDGLCYIQQDLGDSTLYDLLTASRESASYTEQDAVLLCKVVSILPSIQFKVADGLDFSICYPDTSFNERMVDFDLNYFKYCFLKTSGVEFNEVKLQNDFDALKQDLMKVPSDSFMYRDFQARNVMMHEGEPWFIDFQGGRKGPCLYDLASFVYQAKAAYPQWLKDRMLDAYYQALGQYRTVPRREFDASLRLFVLFRTLQVLGAYGFRGLVEKKAHFLQSIPYALKNLKELLSQGFPQYPYLGAVLVKLAENAAEPVLTTEGVLDVHVYSFSYKKGIPEDYSGNGGGYVFDCRAVHNPGKYPYYRQVTGLDDEVIKFLEDDGEIFSFLEHTTALVDAHVKRFLERGFSHLQISFGCTGGQHRSVYSAQKTAEHLSIIPGVRVHLTHRELKIDKYL